MNALRASSIRLGVSHFWSYSWYVSEQSNYLKNVFKNIVIDSFFSNVFFKNSLENFGFVYNNINLMPLSYNIVFVRINFYFTKYFIFFRVILKKIYSLKRKVLDKKSKKPFFNNEFLFFKLKLSLYLQRCRLKHKVIKQIYNYFFISFFFHNKFILYKFYKLSNFGISDSLRIKIYKSVISYFFLRFFNSVKSYFSFFLIKNYKEINNVFVGLNILKKNEISAALISRYIKRRLENYFKFSDFIKRVCKDLELNFYGFLIQGKGRFTRRQRTTKLIFKYRGIYPGTVGRFLDYGKSFAILKYSICCVKVWLSK